MTSRAPKSQIPRAFHFEIWTAVYAVAAGILLLTQAEPSWAASSSSAAAQPPGGAGYGYNGYPPQQRVTGTQKDKEAAEREAQIAEIERQKAHDRLTGGGAGVGSEGRRHPGESAAGRGFQSSDTACPLGSQINGNGCDGTQMAIDVTTGGSAIAGAVGAAATQISGNNAQQQAQQSGKLSDSYRGAADTGDTAAKIQMTLGAIDLIGGAGVTTLGIKHQNAAKTFKSETAGPASKLVMEDTTSGTFEAQKGEGSIVGRLLHIDGLIDDDRKKLAPKTDPNAPPAVAGAEAPVSHTPGATGTGISEGTAPSTPKGTGPNEKGQHAISKENAANAHSLAKDINNYGMDAAVEQQAMATKAKAAGISLIVKGAGELMAGYLAKKAADEARGAADQLDQISDKLSNAPVFNPGTPPMMGVPPRVGNFRAQPIPAGDGVAPPAAIVSGSDPFSPRQATVLSPGTVAADSIAPPPEAKPGDGGGLGDPFTPAKPPAGPGVLPGAARLSEKEGGGGVGGPGGAGLGGAPTTAATDPSGGDGTPRMADNRSDRYETGGGVFSGGGGGAVGADKGPDLSSLLAALTKDDKKDNGTNNSIMDYGRAPASEGGDAVSLLDKSVNIFERVHEHYQDKSRQGAVGLAKAGPKATGG